MATTIDLPQYDAPPVVEVSQGVQFSPLPQMPALFGLFYLRIRSEFPTMQVVLPLPPLIEPLEAAGGMPLPPQIVFPAPMLPRVWFVASDNQNLIQLQSDRLLFNWRKQPGDPGYPHYPHVRDGFAKAYRHLEETLLSEKLQGPESGLCELAYINHIDSPSASDGPSRVFRTWNEWDGAIAGKTEDVAFNVRRQLVSESGDPRGRIYLRTMPFAQPGRTSASRLEIVARGPLLGAGLDGVLAFHDFAHEAIVKTFTAATTDEMHKIWRRRQ